MVFENSGLGKCVILKEQEKFSNKLIYSISAKEFIIISNLNLEDGSWINGRYYGNDLNSALEDYDNLIKEMEELER